MEPYERQIVLGQLAKSEERLLELVRGLTPAQWNFRETPERWSIAQNIEHVIVLENFIVQKVTEVLEQPPDTGKKDAVAGKDSLVFGLAESRNAKLIAREAARPIGRWPDTAELVAELRRTRARTMAFASETQAELRAHFFPHIAFGDLDCYQWLVVLGQHGLRHALQIEEIKANPAYPV